MIDMQADFFIVRYAEIGLKGKNKSFFEKRLIENIKKALKGIDYDSIKMDSSKIFITLNKRSDIEKIKSQLRTVFGVANFSPAFSCETSYKKIEEKVIELVEPIWKENKMKTIKVDSRRSYKKFDLTSMKLNEKLGEIISRKFSLSVRLNKPDLSVFVDVHKNKTFIYFEKIEGLGGLPVGSSGKVVSLLSGGIDSPVASWMMMKRGCEVIFVHFFNEVLGTPDKIEEIVTILNRYQYNSKIYLVPFSKTQKEIISRVPSKYRMIVYRRFMVRIAEGIARKEGALGITTGESIGQVASQTLENIGAINSAATLPIFRPLACFDKMEIVGLAEKLGTYEISIRPYQDCCSYMIGMSPATKSRVEIIERLESKINIEKLVKEAIKQSEIRTIGN
jgi:thiamine biosynthesis protein ThiI